DLSATPIAAGRPTLRTASVSPSACRPGDGTRLSFEWDAEPLGANCNVFVHFVNSKGQMVFQADHEPAVQTSSWSETVAYGRTVPVPTDTAPGKYDVVIGFWNPKPAEKGGGRRAFRTSSDIPMIGSDACRIGTLEVSADAPLPKLPRPSLDLD